MYFVAIPAIAVMCLRLEPVRDALGDLDSVSGRDGWKYGHPRSLMWERNNKECLGFGLLASLDRAGPESRAWGWSPCFGGSECRLLAHAW